jgi:hypothetical protein
MLHRHPKAAATWIVAVSGALVIIAGWVGGRDPVVFPMVVVHR